MIQNKECAKHTSWVYFDNLMTKTMTEQCESYPKVHV